MKILGLYKVNSQKRHDEHFESKIFIYLHIFNVAGEN